VTFEVRDLRQLSSKPKRKTKGFLICFSGIDGSGKTSHARSLLNYLFNLGYSCTYVSGSFRLFLSSFFYGFTWFLGYWKRLQIDEDTFLIDPLGQATSNLRKKIDSVLRLLLFVDLQIGMTCKVRFPLLFRKVVVCDRYVYDIIAGLSSENLNTESFCKLLLQTTPTPKLVFLTDAPKEVLKARRSISTDFLNKKKRAYQILARSNHFYILNSSDDFKKNEQKIRQILLSRLEDNHAM